MWVIGLYYMILDTKIMRGSYSLDGWDPMKSKKYFPMEQSSYKP